MSNPVSTLLSALEENPGDGMCWLALADALEEQGEPERAELLRLHRKLLETCCEPERHPERSSWQARMVELLGRGVRPCVPQRKVVLAEGIEMVFSLIPPGTFLMGSPESELERYDDETPHRVTLTRGYYLGVHPVTQAQWQAVMGENPSEFSATGPDEDSRKMVEGLWTDTFPVENVSWDDSQAFCEKLGNKTGLRFRLPTEAEWEHASRAGTTTPFFFGETISTEQANYDGNYTYGEGKEGIWLERPTLVGSFAANAWGLYDMHGNVWEWCQDWYGDYPEGDRGDPQGVDNGEFRVLRGGPWNGYPRYCRAAFRHWDGPGGRCCRCGCRVLLCLD